MALPDKKESRAGKSPLTARVMLAGTPKVGKSTIAASWAPDATLIVDTHNGTSLLDGEHYVSHVKGWFDFTQLVQQLEKDPGRFKTVVLDLVDDLWVFCDAAHAGKGRALATATDDYGRAAKEAEGVFRQTITRLLATDLGVWFLTHTKTVEDGSIVRHVPKLDGKVSVFVQGACDFVFLAERLGTVRRLHTQPSERFEAGSRVILPSPMELDARELYKQMDAALNPKPRATTKTEEAVAA